MLEVSENKSVVVLHLPNGLLKPRSVKPALCMSRYRDANPVSIIPLLYDLATAPSGHSTHFIYGYMASHIWLRTILIVRKETRCRHIGYSFRLTARVILYAPSHRQDNTYHRLSYTSRGALVGTRNNSMGPTTHRTISYILNIKKSYKTEKVLC